MELTAAEYFGNEKKRNNISNIYVQRVKITLEYLAPG